MVKWLIEEVCAIYWHCRQMAHKHHQGFQNLHHGLHLSYFSMIVLHGPYDIAAGGLLIITALAWIFSLD